MGGWGTLSKQWHWTKWPTFGCQKLARNANLITAPSGQNFGKMLRFLVQNAGKQKKDFLGVSHCSHPQGRSNPPRKTWEGVRTSLWSIFLTISPLGTLLISTPEAGLGPEQAPAVSSSCPAVSWVWTFAGPSAWGRWSGWQWGYRTGTTWWRGSGWKTGCGSAWRTGPALGRMGGTPETVKC